jgi:hypothetical protein
VRVVDAVKPLDVATLARAVGDTGGRLVTVEDYAAWAAWARRSRPRFGRRGTSCSR